MQEIQGTPQGHHHLVRGLGLIAAVSIIIGNVIGTGVFLKARVMTCNLGTPGWVIAAWVAAGILSLAGALTYAELSAMKPEAGGEYAFLRDSYGRVSSFLFGWMQMVIAKPGAQASVSVIFAGALNDFLGGALCGCIIPQVGYGDLPAARCGQQCCCPPDTSTPARDQN